MRLYKYYPEFNENNEDVKWLVDEIATNQIVAEYWFEDEAEEFAKFLEQGGGFAGFTPAFMLTRVSKGNINDAFAAEFVE